MQARYFDENGNLSSSLQADLKMTSQTTKHLLKSGDVLFAAKGTKNFAAVFGENHPPSVASTTFFVLTIRNPDVLPEYLAWVLNNQATQSFLKRNAIGSSMVSISKEVLSDLQIWSKPIAKSCTAKTEPEYSKTSALTAACLAIRRTRTRGSKICFSISTKTNSI